MPDFSKIWATNSPLPDYTFTDSEYLTGWDFVAAAPPTKNQFDAWFRQTDQKLKWLYDQLQDTASKLYPVGSVYISFSATDPSTLFGGTWQRLKDTFLLVNGDTYAADTTGGSATKTITVNNMPAHNHTVSSSGNHTHSSSYVSVSTAGNHTHERGTMNIKGTFSGVGNAATGEAATLTGAFYRVNSSAHPSQGVVIANSGERDDYFGFDASKNWTGATKSNGNHNHTVSVSSSGAHTHTTNNTGGSTPINILPPYTTVYAWKRTA